MGLGAPLVVQWLRITCNAGDVGSTPGSGELRSYMSQSNEACLPQGLEPLSHIQRVHAPA